MRTVIQGQGRDAGSRKGVRSHHAAGRYLNTILALIMGGGTILSLGGVPLALRSSG